MEKWENIFKKYGRQMILTEPGGHKTPPFYALLRPLRYKNKMYLFGVNTPIGYNSQGHYFYIGPPAPDICQEGAVISLGAEDYRVDRAEKVHRGEKSSTSGPFCAK